jgi:succinate dehydrogenase/fumarate reductase cytochrome b subunit
MTLSGFSFEEQLMGSSFRPIAIVVEVVLLMAVIYSLFLGVKLSALDFGLEEKYKRFICWVFMIMGCVALVFFIAHLITFYPRLSI